VQHVDAVAEGLGRSLHDGRSAVAQIVGRDPEALDEAGVSRAAIESAAENFSDGVVAPAFWFALCGLPGIVAYKVINTADSMIGHRSPRYVDFGWAAARLDDVLNWIPARLTGYLFLIVGGRLDAAAHMHRDAPGHRSPNAGWPEAAMAHVLGIALAGPRIYGGSLTEDPFMNPDGRRDARAQDIRRSVSMLWRAWAGLLGVAALAAGLSVLV
jgi:adenosylcobinamide-phosphate synthase